MRVLLTNDDGYGSDGIVAMEKALSNAGHEVWVMAPESQRSGKSHAISVNQSLRVKKMAPRHYTCEGNPADCVMFASKKAIPIEPPYIVISGINCGFNIGEDMIYSGTCGAACEGSLRGFKSIAVSCWWDSDRKYVYEDAASFIVEKLDMLLSVCAPDTYVNVNVPAYSEGKWAPCEFGKVYYHNYVDKVGDELYKMTGIPDLEHAEDRKEGTDFSLVCDKKTIAIAVVDTMPSINRNMQNRLHELS